MSFKSGTLKVLLLEDDAVDAERIKMLVSKNSLDYEITVVETCTEALEAIRAKDFDIALLDSRVPDGSGLDILTEMKNIPAIIITGNGDVESAVRAMKSGASDYLVKDVAGMYLHLLPHVVEESMGKQKLFLEKNEIEKERDRLLMELKKVKSQAISPPEIIKT